MEKIMYSQTKCIIMTIVTFVSVMLFGISAPAAAGTQSWWKQIEQGKQIYDQALDKISLSRKGQDDQQKEPTSPDPGDASITEEQVRESAVGVQDGHFDIEGVYLGMTGEQITSVLQKIGYTSSNDSMPESKRKALLNAKGVLPPPQGFQKGPMRKPGSSSISIRYLRMVGGGIPQENLPAGDVTMIVFYMPHAGVHEEIYQRFTEKYGEPDYCRSHPDQPHQDCTWTNGAGETLQLQSRHFKWSYINLGYVSPRSHGRSNNDNVAVQTTARSTSARNASKSDSGMVANPESKLNKEETGRQEGLTLEGVSLGMHREQVREVLTNAGYTELQPLAAAHFQRRDPGAMKPSNVSVKYGGIGGKDFDRVRVVSYLLQRPSVDWEQRRQELTALFGPPDSCAGPEAARTIGEMKMPIPVKTAPTCVWTRSQDGQTQKLQVTMLITSDAFVLQYEVQ